TNEVSTAARVAAGTNVALARGVKPGEVVGASNAGVIRAVAVVGFNFALVELARVLLGQGQRIVGGAVVFRVCVLQAAGVVRADANAASIGVDLERDASDVALCLRVSVGVVVVRVQVPRGVKSKPVWKRVSH